MAELYTLSSAMEPMLPDDEKGVLNGLIIELIRKSAGLSQSLHPVSRAAVAELIKPMNSYYSNLI